MTAHGVLVSTLEAAIRRSDSEADQPTRVSHGSKWFQFESALPISLTPWARAGANRVANWRGEWGAHRNRYDPTS